MKTDPNALKPEILRDGTPRNLTKTAGFKLPDEEKPLTSKSLNRKERKAQRLLAHYATCERLAWYVAEQQIAYLIGILPTTTRKRGVQTMIVECQENLSQIDGKRISVALFKAERRGQQHAERMCNDPYYLIADQNKELATIQAMVRKALGVLPPGFFVNTDPRGYALKIDCDNAQGKALIDAVGLATDMGGYGLLSPEINGDR